MIAVTLDSSPRDGLARKVGQASAAMRSACRGPTVWWRLCVIMAMIVQSAAGDDVISDPDCTDPGTHYPAGKCHRVRYVGAACPPARIKQV